MRSSWTFKYVRILVAITIILFFLLFQWPSDGTQESRLPKPVEEGIYEGDLLSRR
jgi:hypothetical protein